MQITTFSTPTSTVNKEFEIHSLKLVYLLADKLQVAGELNTILFFEKNYKNFSVKKQVQFMTDFLTKSNWDNWEDCVEAIHSYYESYKKMQLVKHPSNDIYTLYRKKKLLYDHLFKTFLDERIEQFNNWGVRDFITLLDNSFFESTLLDFTTSEMKTEKKFANSNADKILALLFPEDNDTNPNILLLPYEFYFNECKELLDRKREDGPYSKLKIDDSDFCFYLIMNINSFKNLLSNELITLKSELNVCGNTFRHKIDDWLRFCNGNFNLSDQINNLRSGLGVWIHHFGELIDNNQMLRNQAQLETLDAYLFDVSIGMISLKLIWQHFENSHVVDEDTLIALKEKTVNCSKYPINIPVLCISPHYRFMDELEAIKKYEEGYDASFSQKKSLSID